MLPLALTLPYFGCDWNYYSVLVGGTCVEIYGVLVEFYCAGFVQIGQSCVLVLYPADVVRCEERINEWFWICLQSNAFECLFYFPQSLVVWCWLVVFCLKISRKSLSLLVCARHQFEQIPMVRWECPDSLKTHDGKAYSQNHHSIPCKSSRDFLTITCWNKPTKRSLSDAHMFSWL